MVHIKNEGFTLVELLLSLVVLTVIAITFFALYISVLHSSIVSQRQAVALSLANNQMEYLKSLPYNSLAITGGPISSTTTIPGTIQKTENGHSYTITTKIVYVDDAYDGCGSYPTLALEEQYCRNYPPPSSAPKLDLNPEDYKDVRVTVTDNSGLQLATLDTQIASLVAETPTNTGAIFVRVIDQSGNPITGATVNVINDSISPNINVSSSTDSSGIAIFYGMQPDSNFDYQVSATYPSYSSLSTIVSSSSLVATYPNLDLLTQNSSYSTLTLKPEGQYSLLLQTTTVSGATLPDATIYVKGGYKKYTSSNDTSYYYDSNTSPNTSPITDSNGLAGMTNLVPGSYVFCGDTGSTGCKVNGSTYYLAAAVPYTGNNSFAPINVPVYTASNPPTTTFLYNSNPYIQKVDLLLTPYSNFPRINSMSPSNVSIASGTLSNFSFSISGDNLPCDAAASKCTTIVNFIQNGTTYTASCTGTSSGLNLSCSVDLSGVTTTGYLQLQIIADGYTFNLPASPLLGGLTVGP